MNTNQGRLYLVATPIGNLGDITKRAVEVLESVDIIAAEDTRNSIKLLNHLGIKASLTSYHKYNSIEKAYELIRHIQEGKSIALITDAGMPAISDPGEDLVRLCYEAGVELTIIPGACAAVSALAISGLPTRRFAFEAFLPYNKKERKEILGELKNETRTIIIYEAPHKLVGTLSDLKDILGGERKISIVRELTKIHEEVIQKTLLDAYELYKNMQDIKGEYVLVIEGRSPEDIKAAERSSWDRLSIREHVDLYISQGMDNKSAQKAVAADRGITKRQVYAAVNIKDN